jgi:hypothetical protein
MSTLTIRIDEQLKKKAAKRAEKMGVSVSFVVKNALKSFVQNPTIILGEPEEIKMPPHLQKKADKIGQLLGKLQKKSR